MNDNNFDPWLAFLALSAIANAPYDINMPSEQAPCVYNPGIQQAKQEDIDYLNLKNAYESVAHKDLDRLDALVNSKWACMQYDKLKNNPGKKFDDGKIFIDHTKIMLALGRARHNNDTGVIEPMDLEENKNGEEKER